MCFGVQKNLLIDTFGNSENTDKLPHNNGPIHQCLHCLLRQKRLSEKVLQLVLEIITSNTSIYTMDHPDLIACSFVEYFIGLRRQPRS